MAEPAAATRGEIVRRPVLAGRAAAAPGVEIAALAPAARIVLRAPQAALPALGKALGLALPQTPKTSAMAMPSARAANSEPKLRLAFWLGPDEWLVLGPPGAAAEIVAELDAAFAHVDRSVIDVSANRVAIELTGAERFDLLAHVCPLDLDPRVWTTGRCAQTLLGRAQVVLQERTETTGILVRPSFADYVVDLLLAVHGAVGGVGA